MSSSQEVDSDMVSFKGCTPCGKSIKNNGKDNLGYMLFGTHLQEGLVTRLVLLTLMVMIMWLVLMCQRRRPTCMILKAV